MKNNKASFLYWGVFFALMLLKYGYYGFEYFPVMDDWIQYGTYSLVQDPFTDIILKTKMYTVRPLAGFLDIYILGKLWNNMGIVFFTITMLHFLSCYFFTRVFKYNGIKTGYVFLIIYGLLPFGSEATYWVSASSRIVIGLFLSSIALLFLCKYIYESKKSSDLLFSFIFLLLSVGFYESTIVLSFIGIIFILIPNFGTLHGKIATLTSLIPYGVIATYYNMLSSSGQMSGRGQFVDNGISKDYSIVFKAIFNLLENSDIYFYTKGLRRGLIVLITERSFIFLFLILITGIGTYFVSLNSPREKDYFSNIKKIVLGIILFCVPFLIFFPLSYPWISFRNAFTSFVGFAILIEGICDILTKNIVIKKTKSIAIAMFSIFLIIINISELTDFKTVSETDKQVCNEIIKSSKGTGLYEGEKGGYLFNSVHCYSELNKNYHEHINNVTNSTWALTGALRGISANLKIKNITPVYISYPIKIPPENLNNNVLLGIENDKHISILTYKKTGEYLYLLYRANGDLYGEIEYKYGHAFFRKNNLWF